jgi:hypothetical protein
MNGKIYFFLEFVQCFKTFMTNSDPGCIIMGEQTTVCQKKYIISIQNCLYVYWEIGLSVQSCNDWHEVPLTIPNMG